MEDTIRHQIAKQEEKSASEPLSSKAFRLAAQTGHQSVRYERLGKMLTPEIERGIECLREAISLGLINLPLGHPAASFNEVGPAGTPYSERERILR